MTATIAAQVECSYVSPDEGERIRIFDDEVIVKVSSAVTAGAYALLTVSLAPGGGPPLHAHPGNETFTVLSGAFAFTQRTAGGVETFRGGPGTIFHAPAGLPHRFENVSPERSTLLIVGDADVVEFLRELADAFPPGTQPDMEKTLEINTRYNIETFHGDAGSRPEPPKDGATSEQARALAWRYERLTTALITTVAACTPAQWRAVCADTGWTVGVQAHHIAQNGEMIAGLIERVADGRPLPAITPAMIDAANAQHAAESANVTQEETIALLRENGTAFARAYRTLTDAQLARTAKLGPERPPMSTTQLIEYLAIGELERHGAHIRSAIGA
jgi:quercetin dioxygenase-like cupin family protein